MCSLERVLGAECGAELAHEPALAASSIVLVNHLLAVCAIQHGNGATNSCSCGILVASLNGQLSSLHQRTAGGTVWSVNNSITLVCANSLASGFTICQG